MIERQKNLFTGRYRMVRAPNPLEHQLQISLIQRLKWQCRRDDVTYFHPANGELRGPKLGAKLKAMGVLPGVSDLIVLFGHEVLALELKRRGNKLTEQQEWFGQRIHALHGHHFEMADTIDGAVEILRRYGIVT